MRRDVAFDFINPPFILSSFIFGRIYQATLGEEMSVGESFIGAVMAAIVLGLTASLIKKLMSKKKVVQKKQEAITAEQRSRLERELSLLTAGGSAKLSDLPAGQRTVRLRYLNLKAAVCKPFTR